MSDANDFVIESGVLTNYVGPGGDVVIPDGVTSIGGWAFFRNGLADISIPASVTNIGEKAFDGCPKLTIHAPAGSCAEQYAKENNIPLGNE